jgi:hypothetical protein
MVNRMDEPTKNLIPRSAVEYVCRKETVSTNPNDFTHSEMFIRYLDHGAISSFGRWQWANGFNTALVAVKCGLDKIHTVEPERKKGKWIPVINGLGGHECNQCHNYAPSFPTGEERLTDFCPCCGADMREGGQE